MMNKFILMVQIIFVLLTFFGFIYNINLAVYLSQFIVWGFYMPLMVYAIAFVGKITDKTAREKKSNIPFILKMIYQASFIFIIIIFFKYHKPNEASVMLVFMLVASQIAYIAKKKRSLTK